MKNNARTHASLLALAGVYLIYLAWEMLSAMRGGETRMQPWLSVVFIVFFAGAGLGVLYLAWRTWRKEGKQRTEANTAAPERDETHLTKE